MTKAELAPAIRIAFAAHCAAPTEATYKALDAAQRACDFAPCCRAEVSR